MKQIMYVFSISIFLGLVLIGCSTSGVQRKTAATEMDHELLDNKFLEFNTIKQKPFRAEMAEMTIDGVSKKVDIQKVFADQRRAILDEVILVLLKNPVYVEGELKRFEDVLLAERDNKPLVPSYQFFRTEHIDYHSELATQIYQAKYVAKSKKWGIPATHSMFIYGSYLNFQSNVKAGVVYGENSTLNIYADMGNSFESDASKHKFYFLPELKITETSLDRDKNTIIVKFESVSIADKVKAFLKKQDKAERDDYLSKANLIDYAITGLSMRARIGDVIQEASAIDVSEDGKTMYKCLFPAASGDVNNILISFVTVYHEESTSSHKDLEIRKTLPYGEFLRVE